MNEPTLSPIKLVNDAMENVRAAGHQPDQAMVTQFWSLARGEASPQRIKELFGAPDQHMEAKNLDQFAELVSSNPHLAELTGEVTVILIELHEKVARLVQNASQGRNSGSTHLS